MSNSSIAAYPVAGGQRCLEFIRSRHPQWRVVLNAEKFVPDVNAFIVEGLAATLVWVSYPQMEGYELCKGLGTLLKCPWLHLMFQEHVVWEYNLYDEQQKLIDRFEPLPQMWGHDQPQVGDTELLGRLWNINPARLRNYLKPWNDRLRRRKAYLCRDQFRFGQFEQGHDFIKGLTGLQLPE